MDEPAMSQANATPAFARDEDPQIKIRRLEGDLAKTREAFAFAVIKISDLANTVSLLAGTVRPLGKSSAQVAVWKRTMDHAAELAEEARG